MQATKRKLEESSDLSLSNISLSKATFSTPIITNKKKKIVTAKIDISGKKKLS